MEEKRKIVGGFLKGDGTKFLPQRYKACTKALPDS
jgi:hypothetical protein